MFILLYGYESLLSPTFLIYYKHVTTKYVVDAQKDAQAVMDTLIILMLELSNLT